MFQVTVSYGVFTTVRNAQKVVIHNRLAIPGSAFSEEEDPTRCVYAYSIQCDFLFDLEEAQAVLTECCFLLFMQILLLPLLPLP